MKIPKSKRAIRLGAEMQRITGEFLRREAQPFVDGGLVSVTEVRVSDDLRHAELYCSLHGSDDQKKQLIKAIHKVAKRMRHDVATKIRMKKLPEFRFVWDDTLDRADRIEQLLSLANDSQSPPEEE